MGLVFHFSKTENGGGKKGKGEMRVGKTRREETVMSLRFD